ncbi:hypothetical protein B0J14DRAFT_652947 [Halenospora varia]|nr:hypothetical protein B0J14DRAFT_652947 [Halenospora varia]
MHHSSRYLPLDATIERNKLPSGGTKLGNRDLRNTDSDDTDESTVIEEREKEIESEHEEEIFISVGVDFGTTYSGVSRSLSTSPTELFIVSSWETKEPNNHDLEKVPSIVTYNKEGNVSSWGFSLVEKKHHLSWFKMGLSEEATQMLAKEQPERYADLVKLFKKHNKQPVEVSADYLRKLWAHAVKNIEERMDPLIWETIKFKIVLTVPAIWDHRAQELTKQAARNAGMLDRRGTTLELIGEPEAAALAVVTDMNIPGMQSSLKAGDSFVICDAGGGTVDLISYRIEQISPLKLAMCAEATGGCCGAIFLDDAFEKQIRTLISSKEFDKIGVLSRRRMLNDWENGLKRSFRMNAAGDNTWHVNIPGFAGMLAEDPIGTRESLLSSTSSLFSDPGTLTLKRGHVEAIFSEVCSKIKDLVSTQLAVVGEKEGKRPICILPVGGLGGNEYLKDQLRSTFEDVYLRVPARPWSAICRGAVLKGLGNDLVVNHVSKYNYGIATHVPFDKERHTEEDRVYRRLPEIWVAKDQMIWFLKKGDNITKDDPVRHPFTIDRSHSSELKNVSEQIYYSSSSEPETRLSGDVKPLCSLDMKFGPRLFQDLPEFINTKGVKWRQLEYVLELKVSSGQLNWVVKHGEMERGSIVCEDMKDTKESDTPI